ncbi:MAG: hypothetical protein LBP26_07720 [Clostridiales bacterium]|jgi:predicted acetyltransferase|nr:hypothetical protein [Clostridiales bacterium]
MITVYEKPSALVARAFGKREIGFAFLDVDGSLAGFVMANKHFVAQYGKSDFSMAEFFVVYKYRGTGVAKKAFSVFWN